MPIEKRHSTWTLHVPKEHCEPGLEINISETDKGLKIGDGTIPWSEFTQSPDLKEAKAAIEDLLTEQNGPPLIRRHRQWQAAVDRCRAVIVGDSNESETN